MSLSILGRFSVRAGEHEIVLANRKCRALLGYLVLSDAAEETRERLIGLLWSEIDEERARASLRQTLYEIRTALEPVGNRLTATKVAVALDRSSLDVDLWSVMASAKEGRAHPLLTEIERPTEALLAEFETIDPAFRVWLLAKRQALHDRLVNHLEQALHDERGREDARTEVAHALLNLDPTHEEAARALMRARSRAGDVGGALSIYKRLWDLLAEEYDVEPSKETQELVAELKLAQPLTPAAMPKPVALPPDSRIIPAIVPKLEDRKRSSDSSKRAALAGLALEAFVRKSAPKLILSIAAFNIAGSREDMSYLVQGFRRELIACLVRFREWAVRDGAAGINAQATSSSSTPEYVVEADAIGAEASLRLVLTLRDVATGEFLWSHRVNISVDTWFATQQHIVRHLATALNVHLSVERLDRISVHQPIDPKAYDFWLLGQSTILRFDPKSWEEAADLFRKVIDLMPDFAPAYSSLAQLNNVNHIVLPGIFRDARRADQALGYAREAARLDPIDSRSQLSLGWSHAMSKQYDQASIYIPLAYELNDNDPWTTVSAANCLAFLGEHKRAHELADEALALPFPPSPIQWSYLASIRFLESDYKGCVAAAQSAGDFNANVPGYKAASLYHLGEREAAHDEFTRFCEVTRKRWVGSDEATDETISRWFLTMFPIRHGEDWERLRDGLAGAGAPVRGMEHAHV